MKCKMQLIALLSAMVVQVLAPALAQYAGSGSYKYQKGHLDDASKFPTARPQIEILDESPIVKDRRHNEKKPTYEIVVPNQAGGNSGGPGIIRVTPNQDGRILAPPGYQSNIPSAGLAAPKNLPSGATTGIHAQTAPATHTASGSLSKKHGALLGSGTGKPASNTSVAKYKPIPSAQGSTTNKTSTNVSGKVTGRGKLLNP